MRSIRRVVVVLVAVALVAAGCGGDDDDGADSTTPGSDGELTEVSLQLQWFTQGQFGGYYAALDQGFFEDVGLDVDIVQGGVDIVPQTKVADGSVDFAIAWVPKALASRDQGAEITNIGQVFQRSGTLQVSWKDSAITSVADLDGKRVGNWGFGNEFELLAGLKRAGLDPQSDVTLVQQQFDMVALTNRDIDAAQAMTYNEYAQMLETENPDTGELISPDDLSVIDWNDEGTAMLQDAVWVQTERLEDEGFRDVATRFLEASFRGWIFCRDNLEECTDIVLQYGPTLGASHQQWQVNEINKLIWPSPGGIGVMDQDRWDQTIEVAASEGLIQEEPDADAFIADLAQAAVDALEDEGLDVTGEDFEPATVELRPGGE
ncbi:MAG: ABC transporter substrate-binding protein [Acidimicrobiales bacterium]